MKTIKLETPFTLDLDAHSNAHATVIGDDEVSMTTQADAEQSDINYIVRQFGLTESLPYGNVRPAYGDFTDAPTDFHAAQNFILDSNHLFMSYPADVRARFDNDPGKLFQFLDDDKNRPEAESLGFVLPSIDSPVKGENGLPTSPIAPPPPEVPAV